MMYGTEKSDRPILPEKRANKAGEQSRRTKRANKAGEQSGGIHGGKGWEQEECGTAKHGPDAESLRKKK